MTDTEPALELESMVVDNPDGLRLRDVETFVAGALRKSLDGDTRVYGQGGVRAVRLEAEETP